MENEKLSSFIQVSDKKKCSCLAWFYKLKFLWMLPVDFAGYLFDAYSYQLEFKTIGKIFFWGGTVFLFLLAFLANIYKSFLMENQHNINNKKILSEFSRIVDNRISLINSLDHSDSMKLNFKSLNQKNLLLDSMKLLNQARENIQSYLDGTSNSNSKIMINNFLLSEDKKH